MRARLSLEDLEELPEARRDPLAALEMNSGDQTLADALRPSSAAAAAPIPIPSLGLAPASPAAPLERAAAAEALCSRPKAVSGLELALGPSLAGRLAASSPTVAPPSPAPVPVALAPPAPGAPWASGVSSASASRDPPQSARAPPQPAASPPPSVLF